MVAQEASQPKAAVAAQQARSVQLLLIWAAAAAGPRLLREVGCMPSLQRLLQHGKQQLSQMAALPVHMQLMIWWPVSRQWKLAVSWQQL